MVAVSTYFTVSLLFWYLGMVPDLATMRDRANTKLKALGYGLFSLGWRGSTRHWHRYERAYLLLAALATPLVLSVHSVVSFDFAVSQLPGWHTTIFPPYFVAGAVFGGFAMVVTLASPPAKFGLKNFITMRHLENMNKAILLTGSIVGYAYSMEFFIVWYLQAPMKDLFRTGSLVSMPKYWIMIFCNGLAPVVLFRKCRTSIPIMMFVVMCVNVGMWFERFVIVLLEQDFLPSSWAYFTLSCLGHVGWLVRPLLYFVLVVHSLPPGDRHRGGRQ